MARLERANTAAGVVLVLSGIMMIYLAALQVWSRLGAVRCQVRCRACCSNVSCLVCDLSGFSLSRCRSRAPRWRSRIRREA
jgi:hypothetical protein